MSQTGQNMLQTDATTVDSKGSHRSSVRLPPKYTETSQLMAERPPEVPATVIQV